MIFEERQAGSTARGTVHLAASVAFSFVVSFLPATVLADFWCGGNLRRECWPSWSTPCRDLVSKPDAEACNSLCSPQVWDRTEITKNDAYLSCGCKCADPPPPPPPQPPPGNTLRLQLNNCDPLIHAHCGSAKMPARIVTPANDYPEALTTSDTGELFVGQKKLPEDPDAFAQNARVIVADQSCASGPVSLQQLQLMKTLALTCKAPETYRVRATQRVCVHEFVPFTGGLNKEHYGKGQAMAGPFLLQDAKSGGVIHTTQTTTQAPSLAVIPWQSLASNAEAFKGGQWWLVDAGRNDCTYTLRSEQRGGYVGAGAGTRDGHLYHYDDTHTGKDYTNWELRRVLDGGQPTGYILRNLKWQECAAAESPGPNGALGHKPCLASSGNYEGRLWRIFKTDRSPVTP